MKELGLKRTRFPLVVGVVVSVLWGGSVLQSPSHAESSVSTGDGAVSAQSSIVFKIIIPERLEVRMPLSFASGTQESIAADYMVNTRSISVTRNSPMAGQVYNYVSGETAHRLTLAAPSQEEQNAPNASNPYTVGSP